MAFVGKPVRKQDADIGDDTATMSKFKQDLTKFEESVKDMRTGMKTLYESVSELYGEVLPRVCEFQRALQDESTLMENFVKDTQRITDLLRRYKQEYNEAGDQSVLASANRSTQFISTVLEPLFRGQNLFFSESFKVSQVLLDIVSQTKFTPTAQEIKLTHELCEKMGKQPAKIPVAAILTSTVASPAVGAASPGGHRGPGSLVGGAFGSQTPPTGKTSSVKPASRFSSPQASNPTAMRIYI